MRRLFGCFLAAVVRVFTCCGTQAQAVAYNMFLAFFPMLVLGLSVVGSAATLRGAIQEVALRVRALLPPGSRQVVHDFLTQQAGHPWRWTVFGVVGTLLAGSQVMKGLMDGFHLAYRDPDRPSFWSRQARGLLLLSATLGPWIAAVAVTVFGKQLRAWMARHYGLPAVFQVFWAVLLSSAALVTAVLVLAAMYRMGRPATRGWREVLPGAAVATLLWWAANAAFGLYVRHVHYGVVYGGLATAIGLLIWMYLIALIIFIGAAFNAEVCAEEAERSEGRVSVQQ
jgi:membrane protein